MKRGHVCSDWNVSSGPASVLDAGWQAPGGGGPPGPAVLSGGSSAAAGLFKPAPVQSASRPAAVRAPTCLHHRDPAQAVPRCPAGPAPAAGCRRPPHQPRRTHHLPWPRTAGLLPGSEPVQFQKGEK